MPVSQAGREKEIRQGKEVTTMCFILYGVLYVWQMAGI